MLIMPFVSISMFLISMFQSRRVSISNEPPPPLLNYYLSTISNTLPENFSGMSPLCSIILQDMCQYKDILATSLEILWTYRNPQG